MIAKNGSRVWGAAALLAASVGGLAWVAVGGRGAHAAPGELAWDAPTSYTDGSSLPPASIAGYAVQWGKRGGPYSVGSALVPSPNLAMPLPALAGGESCFVVRTVLTDEAAAAKPATKESAATGEVCVVVPFVPGAPQRVRIQ